MTRMLLTAGGARWTPARLGSKLKLWLDERQQNGSPIDSWTNQAAGGIVSPVASGSARPTVGTISGLAAPDFEPGDDIMTSTSALSALVSAGGYYYAAVVSLDGATGVQADSLAYNNNTLLADSGGFFGLHFKDEGSGLIRVQAYHWDGGAKVSGVSSVPVGVSPILIQVWFDGTNINLKVNATTATPTAAGSISTLTGTIRLGTGQALRLNGRPGMIVTCNAVSTAAERAAMDTYVKRWPVTYDALVSNLWGNGWASSSPTFWSSSAMMVIETDSPTLGVRYRSAGSGIDSEYGAMAIMRGASGARYGTTEVYKIPAQATAGSYDTGLIALGGSGSRRIFVQGGCLSGFIGQHVESVYVPGAFRATTSIVTRDATTSVAIDGWGSMGAIEASDGFVVTAGVLSTVAGDITKRAAYRTRIGNYGANECLICLGTNDGAAGRTSVDFGVALEARVDEIVGAGIAAADITIWSPIKRGPNLAGEPAWMAAYRAQAQTSATAKGTGYRDGGTLPAAYSSLGPDQVHPDPGAPEQELADAIAADRGTTGKLLLIGDSILCGSTDPVDWNTARGVVALVRIARI